jgi:archaellum component FlaF (FlaF/FlaG flagellin family)
MKLLPILSEIIDKKALILALKSMDYSEKEAENELKYHINRVKNLPETLTGYRILMVNNKKDINLDEIGSHFAKNKADLLSNHSYLTGLGEKYYLITAKIPKKDVDLEETIKNNILYPHENEITVKNKGKSVKIVKIEEINTENDYFL